MLKITPAQKLKVLVTVIWVCLLIIQALWGERYLEPAGLASDPAGNIYLSLVDSYRAEACLQKFDSSGKRLWSQVYQGKRLSSVDSKNMVRVASGAIYQLVKEYGNNGSSLTILKYRSNGRCDWVKELPNQPYFNDFSLTGDTLEILGMDRNYASLKLTCLSPDGDGTEPLLILNQFNKPTWFQKVEAGVLFAAEQESLLKVIKVKPDGQVLASFTVPADRWLGMDQTEAIYLAAVDGSQVMKYSATGEPMWCSRFKRQWNQKKKEELRADYLEFDQSQNVYLAGQAQLFTDKSSSWPILYNKSAGRYFDGRKYWRNHGGDRIFVAKVNSNGDLMWINRLVTNQSHPKAGGVAVDYRENVYLAGNFTCLDAKNNYYLAKYNKTGKLLWVKRKFQIPNSLFYIGLAGAFLAISLYKRDRAWKLELAILLGLLLICWARF